MPKYLKVKVLPRSSRSEIVGELADGTLKVKLTSPPVEGAANDALLELLAREWDVPKRTLRISHGQKSKNKVIQIDEPT